MLFFNHYSDTKNLGTHVPKKQKMDHHDSINDVKMALEVLESVDLPEAL